jgi:hypothetical protein
MADVVVSVGEHALRREEQGIILQISNSGATLGKLVISKGGLRWLGSNEKEKGGHHFARRGVSLLTSWTINRASK